ncbi:hypothetical protein FB387_005682 [Streptomyces cinereoruber]|uniref:hypothetical protein n=1 Tax=Streptomyces cinereoruber TaxID=67260 RepID=UPI0017EF8964|nr:hypothetical protein [Streptomyces cinereoruber]NIH64468.1 hypothetical protein [Streptomyces cinereoruber]
MRVGLHQPVGVGDPVQAVEDLGYHRREGAVAQPRADEPGRPAPSTRTPAGAWTVEELGGLFRAAFARRFTASSAARPSRTSPGGA